MENRGWGVDPSSLILHSPQVVLMPLKSERHCYRGTERRTVGVLGGGGGARTGFLGQGGENGGFEAGVKAQGPQGSVHPTPHPPPDLVFYCSPSVSATGRPLTRQAVPCLRAFAPVTSSS